LQLDHTEIVIRQRSGLELFDLSLQLLKRHFWQLLAASSLVTLPLLVLDVWLVHWMVTDDAFLVAESTLEPELVSGLRFGSHLVALFVTQFPLMSLPTTVVLGALVFYQPMSLRSLLGELLGLWKPTLLVLGLVRLGLIPVVLEPFVDRSLAFDSRIEFWILIAIPGFAILIRAIAPFAPEIIGLERCPLRASAAAKVTYRMRSSFLHGPLQGDLITRWLMASIHGGLLMVMLIGLSLFAQAVLTGSWQWGLITYYLVFPISLWLVGLLLTVFRYLSYIDSRIRLEGWEIDLRLRAEAQRMLDRNHPHISAGGSLEDSVESEVTR
jgi:hypothetical protein